MLTTDMVVAMSLLAVVMLPISFSFFQDQRLLRAHYTRTVAMEIVDGEFETLMAGEWKAHPEGAHRYFVENEAARNLPPGEFFLTREGDRLQLEWREKRGRTVVREGRVK